MAFLFFGLFVGNCTSASHGHQGGVSVEDWEPAASSSAFESPKAVDTVLQRWRTAPSRLWETWDLQSRFVFVFLLCDILRRLFAIGCF